MGVIKPDPEIFAMVEDDCGLPPEALLFTDDRADNIATAAERGWQTHLFEGPEGWAAAAGRRGLLTERRGMSDPVIIPFEAGEAQLDWLALTEALAPGITCQRPRSPTPSSTATRTRC